MADRINESISQFIFDLKYEDIPPEVTFHLKNILLDSYGCGLFGSTTPWMKIYKDVLLKMTDRQEATIWGTNQKTSTTAAMMLNGSAINSFELDDTHTDGIIHVSTGVLGCITAFAESLGTVSGKDFLTAAVLAFEIACRVAAPIGTELAHQGFNNTGTCCPFGSAAGVAKMLGLTKEQVIHAMGITGNWSSGLQAVQFASMAKRIVPSKSSEGAIVGCLLAKEGFTGIEDVFENKFGGFYNCFTDDVYNIERTAGELGDRWELLGIGLKFYSTCRSKHSTIDTLRRFRQEHPEVKPEDIKKIRVGTTSITHKYSVDADAITSVVAAQLSHPYVCAVTMLEGNAFVDQFTEEKIRNKEILDFAKKVEVYTDEEIEKLPRALRYTVNVEVELNSGQKYAMKTEYPKGHPKNPFTKDELLWKFNSLAGKVFTDEERRKNIVEAVLNLEELDNIQTLTSLLRKEA
ncbi:MAG: MmgE/PrpD family protein [Aminobacterium sp.]|jgi:2-methylcitrate dehydratase PrpD|uniref:MmgE/PrpD family protein n=1 Tax=Aminobacterium sp. TaxID=1872491 RepID=UPI001BCFE173|nr:MmgE/PrpD family protein [Aminobacterium sp.]MDD2207643.1 MmgE/PrpD family protein [Aminobacterium sp.]MDD3427113.1 MmgE/PrpD family protein [Aminobacterium sp.]MDD3708452.1 MmgE/PrpD family protein [Aminobacterium sp.]MDD4229629.1 MmgE/PrpD family protein [Aminobacterium sp.]MDD4552522.1 MmgE/PrpD family protein [Aminobacterium sp.]